jgi:hypothetical protein
MFCPGHFFVQIRNCCAKFSQIAGSLTRAPRNGYGYRVAFFRFPLGWVLLLPLLLPGAAWSREEASRRALETARRDELVRLLGERNLPFEERSLFTEYGGFGTSLHIRFPKAGAEKSFILALPLSKKGDPGTLLPFGFEAALEFAGKMREEAFDGEWGLVFLGDEEGDLPSPEEERGPLGLRDLYDTLEDPEHTCIIYVDWFEPPGKIRVYHGIAGELSPRGLTAPFAAVCEAQGVPYTFAVPYNSLYRLGLCGGPGALDFALDRNIPALFLGAEPGGPPLDTGEAADLLTAYARSAGLTGEQPDSRYTLVSYRGRSFFVSETATVVLLLLGALFCNLIFVIYSLAYRSRFSLRRRLFFPYLGILLLHFGVLYGALHGGRVVFPFLLRFFSGHPRLPGYGGLPLLLLAATALYLTLSLPLTRINKNRRRARLYGNGALVCFFLALLGGIAMDITLVPIFLWALLMGLAGAFIRNPVVVFLTALLAYPQIPGAFVALGGAENAVPPGLLRAGNPLPPLPVALSLFPLLLLFMRGVCLLRRRKKPLPWFISLIPRLLFLAAALTAMAVYSYQVGKIPLPERITRQVEEGPEEAGILQPEILDQVILGQRIITLTLRAAGSPVRFDLTLEAEKDGALPLIHAASMPFSYGKDGRSLRFSLGEGPPNPWSTEISLSPDFSGLLHIGAWYTPGGEPADLVPPLGETEILEARTTLPIASGSP